jgi:hypothetical protein
MRKTILAGAIGVLALTGCATSTSDYQRYAQAQEAIAQAKSEAEIAKYKALETIALKGDSGASVAAAMGIAMGSGASSRDVQMLQPRNTTDKLLPWASLLVPSLTQFYSIQKNAEISITNSNNSLAAQKSSNGMIVDLVQGRIPPVIGTEDDVLLYPR